MTKQNFLTIVLLLVALSAVWSILETFHTLSSNGSYNVASVLLRTLGIPALFAVALWRQLRFLGRNRLQASSLVTTFVVIAVLGIWLAISVSTALQYIHPLNANMPEYIDWAMAGKNEALPLLLVCKVALFNGWIATLMSLPLFLGLVLTANGPQNPSRLAVQ